MTRTLGDVCTYVTDKLDASAIERSSYVSTENMIPNRGGVTSPISVPNEGKVTQFKSGDTLVSNIRPYFKKIWHANRDGSCSNDVLVFRPSKGCGSDYLYWVLSDETFFNYVMTTSKGTKMPRGDKGAIMRYKVPDQNEAQQRRIVALLQPLQNQIELNARTNGYLAA